MTAAWGRAICTFSQPCQSALTCAHCRLWSALRGLLLLINYQNNALSASHDLLPAYCVQLLTLLCLGFVGSLNPGPLGLPGFPFPGPPLLPPPPPPLCPLRPLPLAAEAPPPEPAVAVVAVGEVGSSPRNSPRSGSPPPPAAPADASDPPLPADIAAMPRTAAGPTMRCE